MRVTAVGFQLSCSYLDFARLSMWLDGSSTGRVLVLHFRIWPWHAVWLRSWPTVIGVF